MHRLCQTLKPVGSFVLEFDKIYSYILKCYLIFIRAIFRIEYNFCFQQKETEIIWLIYWTILYIPFTFLPLQILMSAWLNGIGNFLRNVSTFGGISLELRFWILLAGQTLAAISQPFVMFAPTKLAALWFPDSQRATANMLASMGRLYYTFMIPDLSFFSFWSCYSKSLRLFFLHHYIIFEFINSVDNVVGYEHWNGWVFFNLKKSRPDWFAKTLWMYWNVKDKSFYASLDKIHEFYS